MTVTADSIRKVFGKTRFMRDFRPWIWRLSHHVLQHRDEVGRVQRNLAHMQAINRNPLHPLNQGRS